MQCPVCDRRFEAGDQVAMPFCSERCRTIDLGRWLDEGYGLPRIPDPDEEQSDALETGADQ